ncbi:MAG: glycosyltransferase family 2 protein [Methanosphaera sp.]|nr:glycosyltransferase family 2 protein [Methanosphaera sp.]
MNNEVSVIIPNYNNVFLLKELLASLDTVKTPFDIIIVDNNSQDNSVDFIMENYPQIRLIVNDENMGFATAVNQAIKASNTPYLFLLNNDTVICDNTIDELLKTIKSDSKIFSVSSKMIQYDNPQLIDDAGDEYTLLSWSKKRGNNRDVSEYTESCEVFSTCAGAGLYRRDYFNEVGLFDENFESYVEDMDLSFRARIHGYVSYYCADAIVYHHGSATTGSRYNPFKVKISARNNIYLIYKNMPKWMLIINAIFIILGILIKYIFFYKKGFSTYYLEGIKEAIATKNKLNKTEIKSHKNLLGIEWLMIKNTIKYIF